MADVFAIGLRGAKDPINVGHVLRAAHAYGAAMVAIDGDRVKSGTNTSHAENVVPVLRSKDLHALIPYGYISVAVELHPRAVDLRTFVHPPKAFYVFGAEDATLGDKTLAWCKHIIYVPTKVCMNLSACVNVVCYDRLLKGMNHE